MLKHPYTLTKEEIFLQLRTSTKGLSRNEAHKRLMQFGKNVLHEEKISHWTIFFRQFNSPLIFILFFASIVSLILKETVDFFVVFGIICINALIGFIQEVKAASSLAALKKMTETKNMVIRDDTMQIIASSELIPGDCVIFHPGELVTADIRLIESAGLMIDESMLTGESVPVLKNHDLLLEKTAMPYEWSNMLLTGTSVSRGTGKGIVVSTGKKSYLASIGEKAQEASPETPLTKALSIFLKRYVGVLLALLGVIAFVGWIQQRPFVELLYILLATLVSAIPEGLPIALTVVMVLGTMALRKKKALVRHLPSVETLGSTTIIATDKTGTITEGKLIVKESHAKNIEKLQRIAALCNDSQDGIGDPIDVALADWVKDFDALRTQFPKKWEYAFDSSLMMMATMNTVDGQDTLYVKGAYESLKERAQHQKDLSHFDEVFQTFLKKGYRVLAFGEGIRAIKDPSRWELKIEGLIGFIDPPKVGVHEAVRAAKSAGIHVIMITGDHPITAQTIAKEVGIWSEPHKILTGKELTELSDDALKEALLHTTVLARILPEHKYRIVKLLQQKDEIIAVTGDGVNDVPALKAADLGISMGNGSEAAKSASKMILVDNSFQCIVDAIRNARIISSNIRKVIYYLISTSVQELCFMALCIFTSMPLALSAIQILWINLVTDGVMDKTFPFIKEEGNVMKQKPKKINEAFFDRTQLVNILLFGITQGIFCFFLYLYLFPKYSFEIVSTIIFTSIVLPQWANGIQAQKEYEPFFYSLRKSFFINPIAFLALPIGLLLQCTALYAIPQLFKSTPLPLHLWIFPLASFCFAFGIVELRKWIRWKNMKKNSI